MGNLLGAPVTNKETFAGTTPEGLNYAVSSMQGWRVHMEDAHITEGTLYAEEPKEENGSTTSYTRLDVPGHSLFAVFDGHGGTYAAAYAGRNLCRVLARQPKFVQYAKFCAAEKSKSEAERAKNVRRGLALLEAALCDAFVDIDKEIACALKGTKVPDADQAYSENDHHHQHDIMQTESAEHTSPVDSALQLLEAEGDSGTTACVVILTPTDIICANAGDSRAVISRMGHKAVPLSYDHKPDDEEEERRIRAAGGYVAGGRVEGDLAVSRGLGDYRFKNLDVVMAATCQEQGDSENESSNHAMLMLMPGDQKVSPIPDIIVQARRDGQDEFLLIACDGIWDVQTNYEAVQTVAELFKEGENDLGLVCEEVSRMACSTVPVDSCQADKNIRCRS